MRYMVFVKMAEDPGEAPAALYEAMDKELGQAFADGTIIFAGGLGGGDQVTEIRVSAGIVTTTDGPFAEAKEVVGGFSILETRSRDEAIENARRVIELHKEHWPGWEGAVEVHPIYTPEDQSAP
jgi:hypothetical protein